MNSSMLISPLFQSLISALAEIQESSYHCQMAGEGTGAYVVILQKFGIKKLMSKQTQELRIDNIPPYGCQWFLFPPTELS